MRYPTCPTCPTCPTGVITAKKPQLMTPRMQDLVKSNNGVVLPVIGLKKSTMQAKKLSLIVCIIISSLKVPNLQLTSVSVPVGCKGT